MSPRYLQLILLLLTLLLSTPARPAPRCNAQDSLALVALYNSTNGANWTFKTNWFTAYVADWQGIKVVNNRVSEVNLSNNNLTGTLPAELGNLTMLSSLKLYSNAITGAIPPEISKLVNLATLYIHSNRLSGAIPAELGQLTALVDLQLQSNSLTGSIPAELGKLYNLTTLYLHYNQLTGSIPAELGNITKLQRLYLNNNNLSGSIPAKLGQLTNLNLLMLNNNSLSGAIPSSLGSLTKLSYLYLHYNKLSEEIPEELGNLTSLNYLYLNNNALRGTIPPSLGKLSRLVYLYLQMNQLQGNIPVELAALNNLQILNVSVNQLTGTLPEQLGNLAKLTTLDVSTNQLSGTLPAQLGQLTKLNELIIDRNQFSGTIPKSLNKLVNLKNLSLTSNKFTDFLADSLEKISGLSTINIYYNNLTFEDLEDKTDLSDRYFYYSPQNTIGQKMVVSVDSGANYTLDVTCGGSVNHYQWFFNNEPISEISQKSSYRLTDIRKAHTGEYHCHVTNDRIPDLIIESEPIIIQFTPVGEYVPTDILLTNATIDENLPVGSQVGTFTTEDEDYGESHFYSLVDGDGATGNNCFFIAANELHTSLSFDFEKQNSYSIRVQTEDETGNTFQKIFTVSVNDLNEWIPTDMLLSKDDVDEFLPAGTTIGTFSTLSGDSILHEDFTYTLLTTTDDIQPFFIEGDELRTLASFDYAIQSSYSIEVETKNGQGDRFTKIFTIRINDIPDEQPTDILLSNNTINENSPVGTFIGAFTTEGEAKSAVTDFTYTLVDGEGSSDNHRFFIAVNQLHANEVFNYEEENRFTIRVESRDKKGNTLQKSFTITVNDLDDTHTITIPDAFSPNGDGKNDFFETPGAENYSSVVIDIYNRYGKLVYHHDHYGLPDDTGTPVYWDGRLNANGSSSNKVLPEGYYFVVLKIEQNTIYKKTVFLKN